ncbi:MAG: dodecin domain-containing protein [Candidatus Cybelea sp.]
MLAESNKSWDDGAQNVVKRATETLNGIKSTYIKDLEAVVSGDKITPPVVNGENGCHQRQPFGNSERV